MKRESEMPPGDAVASDDDDDECAAWKFRSLSVATSEAVVTLDDRGRIRDWNPAATALFGYEAAEAFNRDFFGLVAATDRPVEQIRSAGPEGSGYVCRRVELMAKRRTGEEFPLEIALFDMPSACGVMAVARRPKEDAETASLLEKSRQQLQESLARQQEMERMFAHRQQRDERLIWQLMHHDPLSGLPNRLLMMERASAAMLQVQAKDRFAVMLVVGIHNFSYINDVLGHGVGDFIMTTVAARLHDCLERDGTLARLDSTEFGVLIPSLRRPEEAEKVAERLLAAACAPIKVAGHELVVWACIGMAVFPGDGISPEALLKNATAAMYQAKREGSTGWLQYAASQDAWALERLSTEEDLRRALERGEFEVFYQPQVDVHKGVIDGAEALIRWRRPGHGLVPPSEFIPLAEEIGLIFSIGAWVLEEACAQTQAWQRYGAGQLRVAVNLSARQFHQADLSEQVARVLKRTGLAPQSLELEITESLIMGNGTACALMLQHFKQMGVRLALDDFGTGYSSLSYLKSFPMDTLKIDQSFVKRIPEDASDAAIVRAITALAKSLKLDLVAEGVETSAQLGFMRDHGCDLVQGYLFSPPVQASEFERYLVAGPHCHAPVWAQIH